MSDDYQSPLTPLLKGAAVYIIFAIIYAWRNGRIGAGDLNCLIGMAIPIFVIAVAYAILAKYRQKHPAKSSVQKLDLDE